jgi:hypothetical protein
MKYYCEYCKFEYEKPEGRERILNRCPYCGLGDPYLKPIPAYETVTQWEARHGTKYPDTAPVYLCPKKGDVKEWVPHLQRYGVLKQSDLLDIVVATELGDPPAGWRPK